MKAGTALLVLDMQNDIMAFHPKEHLQDLVATIGRLIAWAHASAVPVVFSRVAYRPTYVDTVPTMPMLRDNRLLEETQRGSAIIDELAPLNSDIVIVKRRVSAFYNTDLELVLRRLRAETLILTGLSTSRVVESTARDAKDRDFRNIVVSDGCFATEQSLHESALKSIADFFGEVMTAEETIRAFS